MRNTRFEVRPTSGALGAELLGVDLSALDADAVGEIREAFNQHGVIFFRDQRLTPEQHIAFAQSIGPININRFFKPVPGYPQIAEVRKERRRRPISAAAGTPTTATTRYRRSARSCSRARFRRAAATPCSPAWRRPMRRCRTA